MGTSLAECDRCSMNGPQGRLVHEGARGTVNCHCGRVSRKELRRPGIVWNRSSITIMHVCTPQTTCCHPERGFVSPTCTKKQRQSCASGVICVDEGEVDQPAVQPQLQLVLLFGTMMMRRCVLRPARATAAAHASGRARKAPLACRCSASTAAPEVTTAPQQKAEGEAGVKVERRWVLLTISKPLARACS